MDGAEAGAGVTRSILLYVRSHARPGDRARRGKIPVPPLNRALPCTIVHPPS
jgi:hypothetical protein